MPSAIKPSHKAVARYYDALREYSEQRVLHEGALETAFQGLLRETARPHKWFLIPKESLEIRGKRVVPDGTLRDEYNLKRGYWEAKDSDDDLDEEITKKIAKGYPLVNTIFEDTRRAVLFQTGVERRRFDLTDRQQLADLLNEFYAFTEPDIEGFEQAVEEFKERVPELARGLAEKIKTAHENNTRFQAAFDAFFQLCQTALNPNIRREAVDEMLVQHLLTERLIRTIFDQDDFTTKNVIAAEVEKVIDALVGKSFSRNEFLKSLDRFYRAIEEAARTLEDFADKQHFLNTVYERFFQGYSVKVADTHGIVYTPQPIVDFMCASVAEVLESEFGKKLGDPGVYIIDPCTGTGNFIVNLIRRIPKKDLPRMYKEQLFANEVMLLPYYIAALNIEHAYYEQSGTYEPFEGLCFVDTLDMVEEKDLLFSMTEANTARVERQKRTPITVVIGNPPYNAHQINENDNNKNRKYEVIDRRVKESYAKDSTATNKNSLRDPYVKFFRWATDRLEGRDGIVCFVSNNSFLEQIAFDGMRKHLVQDFTLLYHIDLEGNVRHDPNLSGTAYNVFGIQVGVGITIAIRLAGHREPSVHFHRLPKSLRREQKLQWLRDRQKLSGVEWRKLRPDKGNTWLVAETDEDFTSFVPLGTRQAKAARGQAREAVFGLFSNGVKTNRDDFVYDFNRKNLKRRAVEFVEQYNAEVDRFRRAGAQVLPDDFVRYDKIKWSESLKANLGRGRHTSFDESQLRIALYRPFSKQYLYFNDVLIERRYQFPQILPTPAAENENPVIAVAAIAGEKPFYAMAANAIPNMALAGFGSPCQCFPFYVYNEDGSNRRENITDWALEQFRTHYGDKKITKWDIFYYVYGVLHHPGYREKFADNLKRELPRIPFAPPVGWVESSEPTQAARTRKNDRVGSEDSTHPTSTTSTSSGFWAFADAGRKLAELHLNYEKLEPYPLKFVESPAPLSYKVEDKMRLNRDKTELKVNRSLTLGAIPPDAFDYRLGNRSALEWVIDQYQVKEDKRSGIKSDPNRADDPEYVVRLVGQVVRVSLETVKIVAGLPEKYE